MLPVDPTYFVSWTNPLKMWSKSIFSTCFVKPTLDVSSGRQVWLPRLWNLWRGASRKMSSVKWGREMGVFSYTMKLKNVQTSSPSFRSGRMLQKTTSWPHATFSSSSKRRATEYVTWSKPATVYVSKIFSLLDRLWACRDRTWALSFYRQLTLTERGARFRPTNKHLYRPHFRSCWTGYNPVYPKLEISSSIVKWVEEGQLLGWSLPVW